MAFWKTVKFILNHPLNRQRKVAALRRFVNWQLGSRLVPGSVAVPFIGDTRLLVMPGMTGATGNIYSGLHEFEDMAFVLHILRPNDLFVDVGANIGSYSIIAAGTCGASVIAVEPIAQTFQHLVDNVRLNGLELRIAVKNLGLGEVPGELTFSAGLDTVNHVLVEEERGDLEAVAVRMDTLDRMLEGLVPLVIKIDVEGFETAVLKGAARTLESPDLVAIVLELNGSGTRYGFDDAILHDHLLQLGFCPFRYDPFGRTLDKLDGRNSQSGNTIYVRNLQLVAARLKQAERRLINSVEL